MSTAVRPRHAHRRGRRTDTGRRARRLRHQRRPGQGDDLPLAVPPRAARPAELPDRGRGGRRLDRRRPARSCPQGDRGLRRGDRRRGVRSLRRAALVPQRRLWRSGHVRAAREGDQRGTKPCLLPRDPTVALRHGHQGPGGRGPHEGRARGGREALRPRPRLRPRARRGGPRVHRRVPALPDRPLPGEDGPRRRSSTCASRTRSSSPCGTATTCRRCRSRWRRTSAWRTGAISTTPWEPCATWW